MRVAVLTLTRDRLDYTKYCFALLAQNAGCDYDHYVLDNGSTDGTREWLHDQDDLLGYSVGINIGICGGLNALLDQVVDTSEYDVIVRFDNDCEVLQRDTLVVVSELAVNNGAILAPRVRGLLNPPQAVGRAWLHRHNLDPTTYVVEETGILGGIFMAIPAVLFHRDGWRYDDRNNPKASGDEQIVPWHRARGGICGYVDGFEVNHYETTVGQQARYPEYHERKIREMAA